MKKCPLYYFPAKQEYQNKVVSQFLSSRGMPKWDKDINLRAMNECQPELTALGSFFVCFGWVLFSLLVPWKPCFIRDKWETWCLCYHYHLLSPFFWIFWSYLDLYFPYNVKDCQSLRITHIYSQGTSGWRPSPSGSKILLRKYLFCRLALGMTLPTKSQIHVLLNTFPRKCAHHIWKSLQISYELRLSLLNIVKTFFSLRQQFWYLIKQNDGMLK